MQPAKFPYPLRTPADLQVAWPPGINVTSLRLLWLPWRLRDRIAIIDQLYFEHLRLTGKVKDRRNG